MNGFYPIMLKLRGERVVVAGGGRIAERKVEALLEAGADGIVVVSPSLTPRLEKLASEGVIGVICRAYQVGDAENARLLFVATDDEAANDEIAEDGRRWGALIGLAGDGGSGDFASAAAFRRGDLVIAVSASGASPALAARIKRELERSFGPKYEDSTSKLKELRALAKANVLDRSEREALLRLAAEEAPHHPEEEDASAWLKRLRSTLITGGKYNDNSK
ncbi:bifunctional precorrin-2 dehydrogenase/sirohydrochlorin ferrochelatase [Paenibacillus sp. NPDC058071]|uniref:precorrin-2 dehydrogenase/sirohydrochlorin ferrochelatase family protein n=1 Tax=Paenibacillus sp. NPDC058071 TaxID=3346326 RepID=UPI0036DB45F3